VFVFEKDEDMADSQLPPVLTAQQTAEYLGDQPQGTLHGGVSGPAKYVKHFSRPPVEISDGWDARHVDVLEVISFRSSLGIPSVVDQVISLQQVFEQKASTNTTGG
jgi:hypothetical protein